MVGFFRFEIEPWAYARGDFIGSAATVLRVTVEYNGRQYGMQEIMPAVLPWESELDHYTRIAVAAIKRALREEYEKTEETAKT